MGLGKPHIFWRSPPSSAEGLRRFHITLISRQTKPFHRLHRVRASQCSFRIRNPILPISWFLDSWEVTTRAAVMANLLALLNPAPQAEQSPPAPGTQLTDARGVASNQKDDHHDMRPANIFTGGSPRPPSLTSPLDALAEAATSSAPLPSPSRPTHTSISHDMHYQSLPTPSSRPTSSHASPPKPFELPRMPQQSSIGQFSPGLQQYHHSSSDEVRARRLSNIANTSAEALPPLRKSVTDENLPPPTGLPAIEPHTENDIIAKGSVVASSIPISPSFEPTRPIPEPLSPVTSQIQEPPPSHVYSSHSPDIPEEQSVQVQVKTEVPEIPSELSKAAEPTRAPVAQMSAGPFAQHTTMTEVPAAPKSVANLKNEAANDPSHIPVPIEASTPKASAKPKQAPSKKRAAPKKGTASAVKPTNKKRKTENGSVASSPALPRTGTPASSRASKTPAPKGGKQGSVTPARSSSVANAKEEDEDEEMDEGDSSELFCICRKPDDHTWMIGCDGPCEDWFHGRCVNMNERDGNLIDKYFCECNLAPYTSKPSLTVFTNQALTAPQPASAKPSGSPCAASPPAATLPAPRAPNFPNTAATSTASSSCACTP